MDSTQALPVDTLYKVCETDLLPFQTTETLESYSGFFGQERALEAMGFGVSMRRSGYNLFVMGNPHTGRFSFAMDHLKGIAKKEKKPHDWCYLNNLTDFRYPLAVKLPAGKAEPLRRDHRRLMETIKTELPAAFENPTYQRKKSRIERDFNRHYDRAIEGVEKRAREYSIALYRDAGSVGFTPVADGQAMDEAAFSQLPEEVREALQAHIAELEDFLNESLTGMPQWRREAAERIKVLDRDTARQTVSPLIQAVKEKYKHISGLPEYFNELESHIVKNSAELLEDEKLNLAEAFGINLFVDHSKTKGSAVVFEAHPTYENLFGRIEYSSEMGAMVTNYRMIRPGALHQANGGYLVLEAEKLLEQPFVYGALKRALKAHEIRIENPMSDLSGVNTTTLSPAPIALNVKVVLIGSRNTYYLLQSLDQDFEKIFRVVVDFDEEVERSPATIRSYARLMKTLASEEGLAPLTRSAVARLVEHSSRLAGDQTQLSTHIGELVDLLCEADYKRMSEQETLVNAKHVDQALEAKEQRTARLSQKILESILNETVLIDTQGHAVGQCNGLTVLQTGDVAFGTPARITATVHPGNGGIVDIEREVQLGQSIHSKGVLILSGFLGHRYAQTFPLTLSASIALEQSYGYIDGDSASLAEICTLISALTRLPIQQSYAITGSINQYGEVQAIGGVNEKIEGFFTLCHMRGLTGLQGVIIPQANVRNLMLKKAVVDAVAAGHFAIYAVATVDECLELLMQKKAGTRSEAGSFPHDSINACVVERLQSLHDSVHTKK